MNNDKKISIFFLIFVGFFVACFFFASKNGLRGPIDKDSDSTVEIEKYAIQTHEYFANLDTTKYIIDSKEELEVFNSKFDVDLKLSKKVFKNNTVFVQIEEVGSGSVEKEVTDVLLDDSIIFVIKTKSEGVGTDDMALWYYVAIIPNDSLSGIYYDEWAIPSNVISNEVNYVIVTDSKYLTMRDDGGSNTNIYYDVNTTAKTITKTKEVYEANLTGTPETKIDTVYEKDITDDDIKLIENLYKKDDIKDSDIPFKINDKSIYSKDTINSLKELLEKYDNA